jgi:DNA-binding NarL/FixJ family response regulator
VSGSRPLRALTPAAAPAESRSDRVLALLSTGATDEAIARQLGVSLRTVQRDVRGILDQLGARTRFQAGQLLGRRLTAGTDEQP